MKEYEVVQDFVSKAVVDKIGPRNYPDNGGADGRGALKVRGLLTALESFPSSGGF